MDFASSELLLYIMETLSKKPELCATYGNLCAEIKRVLSLQNLKDQYQNVDKYIQTAVDVGESLGILTKTNNLIRMPFKYLKKLSTNSEKIVNVQPRRTHSVRPTLIAHGRRRRRTLGMRRRRSRGTRKRSRRRHR